MYIKFSGSLSAEKVEYYMGELHWESESPPMRCKGLFLATDSDGNYNQYLLQGVDDTFEWRLLKTIPEPDLEFTHRFLFVGKNIDKEDIEWKLKACL